MKKLLMATTFAFISTVAFAEPNNTNGCNPSGGQPKKCGDYYAVEIDNKVYNVTNVDTAAEAQAAALAYANATGGNASATGGAGGQGGQGGQGGKGGDGGNSDQEQSQEQGQSQTSENNNSAYNGGNSVNFEGDPAHTTSLNANVGLNVTLPIGAGIQAASCRDTVRLAREMGQETLALQILLECPHVRKLNLKVNPGDKG